MRLTHRGRILAFAALFTLAFILGACGPLWDAMPWATP